jgi:hypothetical protein
MEASEIERRGIRRRSRHRWIAKSLTQNLNQTAVQAPMQHRG